MNKTIIKKLDMYKKYYLWMGSYIKVKQPPKKHRHNGSPAKDDSALGVLNLRIQNEPYVS